MVVAALQAMEAVIVGAEDELGRIDAVAGDGDHGRGMVKGIGAATGAAARSAGEGHGAGGVLAAAGEAWATRAGGTSGVLWGAALQAVGDRLGDRSDRIAASDVAEAVAAGLVALQTLGQAALGDKTMLDALIPFVESLQQQIASGAGLAAAWTAAADVSDEAAAGTADLRPRIGRARPLAERSVGTPDAGAVSMALCLRAVAQVLTDR